MVLRGKHTEKSDQNSKKIFSVLAGLKIDITIKHIGEHHSLVQITQPSRWALQNYSRFSDISIV
jgi:hypothetical protein